MNLLRSAALVAIVIAVGLAACISRQDLGDGSSDHPIECDEHPCTSEEVCFRGACRPRTKVGGQPCDYDRAQSEQDDCAIDAVCVRLDEDGGGTCKLLEPCTTGYVCPVGGLGAVCNRADLGGKARVCLERRCTTRAHCPEGYACIAAPGPYGHCSNGSPGSFCAVGADCRSGRCFGIGIGLCL